MMEWGGEGLVFNAIFSNISVISWRSVLFMETVVPGENHRLAIVVIGTDCIGSCKSN